MPITDKVAAAKQIGEFLQTVITNGGFKLKYRITVDPPIAQNRDWEHPEILVEFAGPDSTLLLERGGELLRSFELLALGDSAPPGQRAREDLVRLQEFSRAAHRRNAARGADCGRKSAAHGRALSFRSNVIARAPHRASRVARRKRFAHRERRRRRAALRRRLSGELQDSRENRTASNALTSACTTR